MNAYLSRKTYERRATQRDALDLKVKIEYDKNKSLPLDSFLSILENIYLCQLQRSRHHLLIQTMLRSEKSRAIHFL